MPTANPEDVLIDPETLPWIPMGGPGLFFRLLRVSPETGQFTIFIKLEAGASFAPHKHLGAADFFVLSGALRYRAGTARAGSWGYEPLGVFHQETNAEEETVLLYNGYGGVAFTATDGAVVGILDWEWIRDAAAAHAREARPAA